MKTTEKMNGFVCDNCLSDDITKVDEQENDADCFCNSCQEFGYTVSVWWLNRNNPERLEN